MPNMQAVSFELDEHTLTGLTCGDPDKPMILALHGWLDNAASFIPLSEYLSDYYLVALDLTGHGHSSHRGADAHYHLVDYVHDLHGLISAQGWPPFILLGHSMGGIIASLYASSFPEQVSKFIVIESLGPMTKADETAPEQLRESIENRLAAKQKVTQHPDSLQRVTEARAKTGDMSLESAKLLVERNILKTESGMQWRTDKRLRTISSLRLTQGQARGFLQGIRCPTLAIRGSKGFDMVKNKFAERQKWIAQLTTIECEGGHHLHMDNPGEVADKIHNFLA